ncbi:hypothetical protein N0V84_005907 [Fusarium piperis]|uniref:Pathway-specific nitrogen regulator n=1 Tax=Fusarium piperis TaxID=1435070 RepID=A0A9W8WCS2_9HYPO|nr:hypothetical protein N0V84_005907 [Fusarium piperis]
MPRRYRAEDLDFEIHVDPSCLSDPMDDNEHKGHEEPKAEEQQEHTTTTTSNIDTEQEPQLPAEPKAEPAVEGPEEDGKPIVTPVEPEDDKQTFTPESEAEDDTQDELHQDTEELDQETPKPAEAEAEHKSSLDDHQHEDDDTDVSSEDESEEHQAKAAASETKEEATTENQEEETHSDSESDRSESRRGSSASSGSYLSDRRHSDRTEALIQKAARDIVSQIGSDGKRDSLSSYSGSDETGYLSRSESSSARQSDAHMSVEDGTRGGVDEAGDNSSHHEHEDDVFSDRSPRSSIGSVSETDNRKAREAMDRMTRSPRISGISGISGISEYEREEDEFIPTIRGTPRPAFRSPSSVKAMQMSSPPASVMGSPRSSRRAPLPTVSRIGSPRFSEQYSPKKTPPRFKRATPPLVLLHVTLLPLRWPWGDVLENADPEDMSQEAKTIRDAWRQLQDRMGDTTVERGILLPHPQNDYEVLEERLLEALELPMRRRARILECGHYLGPSNVMTLEDESSSESEDSDYDDEPDTRRSSHHSQPEKTHWCKTCRSDIRYESLGPGKLFRVKVYASNGLIRGGAWEACWKEMERVDVEIEPLVDAVAQHELVQLEADQERELAMREAEEEERYVRLEEEHREFEERERGRLSKRRGESRSHVDEDESHLTEDESHLEESHLRERSLRAESHHESRHEESLHDITGDHQESHIADTTEPVDEKAADTTREPAEDTTKDYTDDLDKNRSFDELEKDLDEHLQEEHERRSQADESRMSFGPDADVSQMDTKARAAPSSRPSISPEDVKEEERKRRDEERLKEIYGDAPAQDEHARSFPDGAQHHDQQYAERGQPGATDYQGMPPSGETYTQNEDRQKSMKSASLPELLAESARVLMQDKKNVLIGLLSVLILLLAIRGGPGPAQDPRTFQTIIRNTEVPTVTVTQEAVVPTAEAIKQATPSAETVIEESSISVELPKESVAPEKVAVPEESPVVEEKETVAKEARAAPEESVVEEEPEVVEQKAETSSKSRVASSRSTTASASAESVDPCASCSLPPRGGRGKDPFRDLVYAPPPRRRETETETLISERVVRVVETVTAMETATVKVTETATEVVVSRETQYVKASPEEKKAHEKEMGLEVPGKKEQQVPLGSSEAALEYLEIEAPVDQTFDLEAPRKEAAPPTRQGRQELDAEAERLELPWN